MYNPVRGLGPESRLQRLRESWMTGYHFYPPETNGQRFRRLA